jgi:hypothetical protein
MSKKTDIGIIAWLFTPDKRKIGGKRDDNGRYHVGYRDKDKGRGCGDKIGYSVSPDGRNKQYFGPDHKRRKK